MDIKKFGEGALAIILLIMVFGGYIAMMSSVLSGVVYAIYLAGPGGVAIGMALWKGLILFFSMFFGGFSSILTASLIGSVVSSKDGV